MTGLGIAVTTRVTGVVGGERALGEVTITLPVYVPANRPLVDNGTGKGDGACPVAGATASHVCPAMSYCTWAVSGTAPVAPVALTRRFCAGGTARPMI